MLFPLRKSRSIPLMTDKYIIANALYACTHAYIYTSIYNKKIYIYVYVYINGLNKSVYDRYHGSEKFIVSPVFSYVRTELNVAILFLIMPRVRRERRCGRRTRREGDIAGAARRRRRRRPAVTLRGK